MRGSLSVRYKRSSESRFMLRDLLLLYISCPGFGSGGATFLGEGEDGGRNDFM